MASVLCHFCSGAMGMGTLNGDLFKLYRLAYEQGDKRLLASYRSLQDTAL